MTTAEHQILAADRQFNAALGRYVRAYGKERAALMGQTLTFIMSTISTGKDRRETRDMLVDLFKTASKLIAIAQEVTLCPRDDS